MLSKQEDFDRDVKRVLQEVNGEEIPLDFLVDIEQRLDQLEKKKKRRVLVWFFTGVVLASGLTFGLLRGGASSNMAVKTTPQKGSNSEPIIKVFKQADTSKKTQFRPTNPVQTAFAKRSEVTTKMVVSASPRNRAVATSLRKNQLDLSQEVLSIEHSASDQTQNAIVETRQDVPVLLTEQKTALSPSNDSVKTESPIKNELTKEELSPAPKIPEIVMNTDLPKWTHSFGFYTGMSGVISSFQTDDPAFLSYVGTTDLLKYRELRSTQERSTSSIDLSLRYRMAKKHLVLQTGVDFFEWGEQIQYDYSFVYDGLNRYSYLSLPVYLGYRQAFHSFEWTANIGCSVGHVLQQQGRYIQPDLVTLALENARTWTATGLAQVEFMYIFDRYRFTLAPSYRMSLGNVVNSAFTKNRYFSFGLQMGMAYQF
ncbi:MAG: hypothetical protein RLZZ585_1793 [Bacteroidota bacterium]|jgi:hypothetical protein